MVNDTTSSPLSIDDEAFTSKCSLVEPKKLDLSSNAAPPLPKKQPSSTTTTTNNRLIKKSISKPTSTTKNTSKHGSYVFVRVRPLLSKIQENENNIEDDESLLKGLVVETSLPKNNDKNNNSQGESITAMEGSLPISGFNGVLGINAKNDVVFQQSFLPRLDTIMKGGTASFFCYGYTGAGKTHTTLGYGEENGVFHLAAEEIFKRVSLLNEARKAEIEEGSSGDVEEVEKGLYKVIVSVMEVYNDEVYDLLGEKAKCSLRKNKRGQLLVRGATEKVMFTEEEAKKNGFDYSVVTKTLSAVPIQSIKDLKMIQSYAHQYRKVGISTTHTQSSRSHAIFRLDIVNQTLLDAMKELEEAEQIKPAVQTAYDKKRSYQLRHRVLEIEKKIDERSQFIDDLYCREAEKQSPFGGRLILVDLAGADSDGRSIGEGGHTAAQRKESTAINKSLMALKECISGLSSSKPMRAVPFRNSSLTRLLEEVLTPREKRDSDSVMIVNIGPEEGLKSKTVNSLRYGSMFSSFKQKKPINRGGVRTRSRSRTRGSLMEAKMRMKREMEKKE
jgi:hypothetical protein